jgi:hypothetical protein
MEREITLYRVVGMHKIKVEAKDLDEFLEKVEEIKKNADSYDMVEADRDTIVTWMNKKGESDCEYNKVQQE